MNNSNTTVVCETLFVRSTNFKNLQRRNTGNVTKELNGNESLILRQLISRLNVMVNFENISKSSVAISFTIPKSSFHTLFQVPKSKIVPQFYKFENDRMSNKIDDHFIFRLREIIEQNIDDDSFSIKDLCRTIGLSRSQLHNKIKSKTGLSTSIFIRQIRLEKSRALLKQTEINISEVAYAVGFKNPSYFSRLFSKKYGISPSQYKMKSISNYNLFR